MAKANVRTVTLSNDDRERVWKLVTERYALSGGSLVETFTGIAAEYALLKEVLDSGAEMSAPYHDAVILPSKAAWLDVKFHGEPQ